jgi:hypothetical protein
MFEQCPALAIQSAITSSGVAWPRAMFSPMAVHSKPARVMRSGCVLAVRALVVEIAARRMSSE